MKKVLFLICVELCFLNSLNCAEGRAFLPSTFKANFNQSYKSSLTGKEKSTKGGIEYKFPGHLRFEIYGPNKTLFITNPKKTWYYNAPFIEGESGEVTIKKTGKMVLSKFFDALKEGLSSNKHYKVEKVGEDYHLHFSKKILGQIGITKSILRFKGKKVYPKFSDIQLIWLFYQNKRKVKMTFSNLRESMNLDHKRFIFKIPKNTKVSNQ